MRLINAVREEDDQIAHFIAVAHDISEHKANGQRISHLAHHDVLTDLPNLSLCIERLRMALQQADRQRHRVVVLFIDLDRFKNINDSRSLLAAVRLGDTVSRFGSDEFVVILNDVADAEGVENVEETRMLAAAGCDELQGYLFSGPLPEDEFVQWQELARRRSRC